MKIPIRLAGRSGLIEWRIESHAGAAESPAKILVIDDDEPFRAFVREALETFTGYELKEAGDGMTGALLVGSWHPDLVLLDVRIEIL